MADPNDFMRVDFKRLLGEPDGFELQLAPIGNGSVTAVRLRTGRGMSSPREMNPTELTALLSRLLADIGGGTLMEDFDPEKYAAGKRAELAEIEEQLESLRRRKIRVGRELQIMGTALAKLSHYDENAPGTAIRRDAGGARDPGRSQRMLEYVEGRSAGTRAADLAQEFGLTHGAAAAWLKGQAEKGAIRKADRGLFAPNTVTKARKVA